MRRSVLTELSAELEQASTALAGVYETLLENEITDAGQEIDRRRLEQGTRAVESLARDLLSRLRALKLRVGGACPHCGWMRRYQAVARCPRCNRPRAHEPPRLGVVREARVADPRDAGGEGSPPSRKPGRR